jgi:VanZ family protein
VTGAAWRWRGVDTIVVAVVFGILYASLGRYGWFDCRNAVSSAFREGNGVSGSDLLGNVFAYLLLGAALGASWAARRPSGSAAPARALVAGLAAVAACAMLSVSMELVQACLGARVSSGWDVAWNVLGAALGWLLARAAWPVWHRLVRAQGRGDRRGPVLAVVSLALLAWVLAETAPWVPVLDGSLARSQLKTTLAALREAAAPDPWRLARNLGEWLAAGLAIALAMRRPLLAPLPFAALAVAVVGARLLLPGALPSVESLHALAFALPAIVVLPALGRRACAALALAAVAVALLAYQLEPGYGPTTPFRWRITLLQGDPIEGIELACFFGAMGLLSVVAGTALGGAPLAWAAAAPALLAATEWAQTQLPGRTPDLSPLAMAAAGSLLAAGVLAGTAPRPATRAPALAARRRGRDAPAARRFSRAPRPPGRPPPIRATRRRGPRAR